MVIVLILQKREPIENHGQSALLRILFPILINSLLRKLRDRELLPLGLVRAPSYIISHQKYILLLN